MFDRRPIGDILSEQMKQRLEIGRSAKYGRITEEDATKRLIELGMDRSAAEDYIFASVTETKILNAEPKTERELLEIVALAFKLYQRTGCDSTFGQIASDIEKMMGRR